MYSGRCENGRLQTKVFYIRSAVRDDRTRTAHLLPKLFTGLFWDRLYSLATSHF